MRRARRIDVSVIAVVIAVVMALVIAVVIAGGRRVVRVRGVVVGSGSGSGSGATSATWATPAS